MPNHVINMIDVQGDPRRINEMRQAVQNDDSMTLADKITNVSERLSRMEGVSASEMTELSRLKDNLLDSMRNRYGWLYVGRRYGVDCDKRGWHPLHLGRHRRR